MANIFIKTFRNQIKCAREFHTSLSSRGQVKIIRKVLHGDKNLKRKSRFFDSPKLPSSSSFGKGPFDEKKSQCSKRATVLNKLYMRYITDLMATGECSASFVGHGIEINRVQVTPDYQCVNVYWIARGNQQDDVVESILSKNAGHLRHELSELKLVGVAPKIKFVKDKHFAKMAEIDRLLSQADFGEDHVPVDPVSKMKDQLQLDLKIEPHIIEKIEKLDHECEEEEEPLPPMTQNVFNLNRNFIMESILKQMKKRSMPIVETEENHDGMTVNKTPICYTSTTEEREAFRKFFEKRQIMRYQAKKMDKTYRPEMDYLEEEWISKHRYQDEHNPFDDKDYIEQDV